MLNKVTLMGFAQEPETKSFSNGNQIVNFSLSTSERYKDSDGSFKFRSVYHKILVLNEHLIKYTKQYVKKGAKVYLEGELKYEKYTDKNGVEREITKIILGFNAMIKVVEEPKEPKPNSGSDITEDSLVSDDEIPF